MRALRGGHIKALASGLARRAMIRAMVEYGGGIDKGPAGQVGGNPTGGGSPNLGSDVDFFGNVGNTVGDVWNTVAALPTESLVLLVVAVFVGLVILRRAF
jgi:hypothetical protein